MNVKLYLIKFFKHDSFTETIEYFYYYTFQIGLHRVIFQIGLHFKYGYIT